MIHDSDSMTARIQALMPSVFAGTVMLAGMAMLYDLIVRGLVSSDAGLAIVGPILGAAVAYVFQRGAIDQTARAVTNGAATAAVARAAERMEATRTPVGPTE